MEVDVKKSIFPTISCVALVYGDGVGAEALECILM